MFVADFLRWIVKLPDREEKPEKLSISLWAQKGLKVIPELDSWWNFILGDPPRARFGGGELLLC